MVSGPYASGAATAAARAANLAALNRAAAALWARGHMPVIGVNMALPVIAAAGEEHYDSLMLPLSMALAERCDGCLRIGGASAGADREAAWFSERGLPVYHCLEEVPD
ncbi:MAG: hypothetical protein OHK0024_24510 [Thalassobaculales bacterium]